MSAFEDLHAVVQSDILAKLRSRPLTCQCDVVFSGERPDQVVLCDYHLGMSKGVDDALEWEEEQW